MKLSDDIFDETFMAVSSDGAMKEWGLAKSKC
jgi:hypothetical protein